MVQRRETIQRRNCIAIVSISILEVINTQVLADTAPPRPSPTIKKRLFQQTNYSVQEYCQQRHWLAKNNDGIPTEDGSGEIIGVSRHQRPPRPSTPIPRIRVFIAWYVTPIWSSCFWQWILHHVDLLQESESLNLNVKSDEYFSRYLIEYRCVTMLWFSEVCCLPQSNIYCSFQFVKARTICLELLLVPFHAR